MIVGKCQWCQNVIPLEPVAICKTCCLGKWGGAVRSISWLQAEIGEVITLADGRPVTLSEVVDWVWGDDEGGGPDDAKTFVGVAIHHLRFRHGAHWIESAGRGQGWRRNMEATPREIRRLRRPPLAEQNQRFTQAIRRETEAA